MGEELETGVFGDEINVVTVPLAGMVMTFQYVEQRQEMQNRD